MKICPVFRIQNVKHMLLASLFKKETKKQGQKHCSEKEKGLSLAVGWEDSEFFPEGLILKLLLPGDSFNSFLLDGNTNLFFTEIFTEYNLFSENCPANRI